MRYVYACTKSLQYQINGESADMNKTHQAFLIFERFITTLIWTKRQAALLKIKIAI